MTWETKRKKELKLATEKGSEEKTRNEIKERTEWGKPFGCRSL